MAHNTPMKCGNRGCEYELYSHEADFLICPGCGEPVLLDRVRSVACDRRLHTPADRVMDNVKQLRFWGGLAWAFMASSAVAWYWGGPSALEAVLRSTGGSIFLEASPYVTSLLMVVLFTKQFVPQMRLWFDDPNWMGNTNAQMLIRTLPYVVWSGVTIFTWSWPSVTNLYEALANHPAVATDHPQMVMATTIGAYLVPLIAAGIGVMNEGLEVINQRNIARVNAILMRNPPELPYLDEDNLDEDDLEEDDLDQDEY